MTTLAQYQLAAAEGRGPIATITLDDGKVNALSPDMQASIHAALDQAEADGAVVVLTGRSGILSAGFDLKVLRAGGSVSVDMVIGGLELGARLLAFPTPVVIACTGHAMAMGSFLLLSADHRIGATGDFKIVANEVAIGMTMPHGATEIMRQRLAPATFNRAAILAEVFDPAGAVGAGFLDQVVPPDELASAAADVALRLSALNMSAHAATKHRVRGGALAAIRAGIAADRAELEAFL